MRDSVLLCALRALARSPYSLLLWVWWLAPFLLRGLGDLVPSLYYFFVPVVAHAVVGPGAVSPSVVSPVVPPGAFPSSPGVSPVASLVLAPSVPGGGEPSSSGVLFGGPVSGGPVSPLVPGGEPSSGPVSGVSRSLAGGEASSGVLSEPGGDDDKNATDGNGSDSPGGGPYSEKPLVYWVGMPDSDYGSDDGSEEEAAPVVPEAPPIVPKVAPVVPEMVEEKPTILGMSPEEFKKRLARPVWTLTSRKVYESRRDNRLLFNIDPFRQGPRDLHIAQRQRFAEHWCKKMAERRRAEAEARYDAMPIIRCQTLWRRALARRAVKQRFALEKRSQAAACEAIVKIMRLGLEKQHAYLRGENFRGRLLSEYLGPLNSEGSIKASITAVQAHSRGFNARVKAARDFASAPAPVAVTASAPTSSPFSPLPVRHQPADSMRQTGMSIPPTYADEAPVAAAETWMSLTSTSVAVVGNAPAQSWVSQTPTPVTMDASSAPVRSLVSQTPTFTAAQPSSSLPTPPPPSQPAPMPSHQAPISTPSAAAVSTPHPAPLLNMDSSVLPASACTSFPSRDGEKGTVGPTMSMSTDAAPAAGRRVLTAKRRARQDLTSGFQDTVVTAQREKIEEEKKSLQKVVDAQAKMIAEAEAPIQARDALHEQFRDHTDRVTINEEIARAQAQINAPNTFAASGQVTDQELLEDGSEEGEAREDGEGSEEGEVQEGGEDEDDGEFDHPFYGLTEEEISDLDSNASPPDWDRDELYDDAGDGADAGDGPYSPPYSVGSSGLSSTESMEDPTAPAAGPSGTALDPNGADADVDDGYADNPEDQVDFGGVDDEDDDEDDDGPPLLPMSAVQKGKQRALAAPSLAGVSGAWCVAHVERG